MLSDYILVDFKNFEPQKLKQIAVNGQNRSFVCKDFVSLDTEVSKDEVNDDAWIYQWAFSYPVQPPMMKRQLVYGRKPSDLAKTIKKIADVNGLDEKHKLNIFVHNLSFDYHYFKDFIEKEFGYKGETLAVARHKMITYTLGGVCFRCTYKLTNKSLDAWAKEIGTKHKKLKGTIDYNIRRYQDSSLNKKDWKYMFYDVVTLDECVERQNIKWEDDMLSIPLTLTGYVRRECFKHFEEDKLNKNAFKAQALTPETYKLCRDEFSGGLTHGNRFYARKTLKVRNWEKRRGISFIRHRDFASHYPSQQVCGYAPTSKFSLYYRKSTDKSPMLWNELADVCNKKCVLATMAISNLKLKPGITLPTAQVEKFRAGEVQADEEKGIRSLKMIADNGRILEMYDGMSIVTMNEYDLKWLKKQYSFKYEIISVYTARRGRFPSWLVDTVKDFYYKKSHYKMLEKKMEAEGVSKDSVEYIENHLNMVIAKSMLNAIYGCSASKIVRTLHYEDEFGAWKSKEPTNDEIAEQLESYYNSKKSFMNYELGCWTTSSARDELLTFVELIGYENYIYADTDSIFYFSNDEIEAKIEAKNKEFRDECDKNGWFIECDNKRVYFNQFELEKEDIVSFRFLHAKCYAYEVNKDGKIELEATIAGVTKDGKNGCTRVKELGSIENLVEEKDFVKCGGTSVTYINSNVMEKEIDGHTIELASAAIIKETTKTLHDALWYAENLINWEVEENA